MFFLISCRRVADPLLGHHRGESHGRLPDVGVRGHRLRRGQGGGREGNHQEARVRAQDGGNLCTRSIYSRNRHFQLFLEIYMEYFFYVDRVLKRRVGVPPPSQTNVF